MYPQTPLYLQKKALIAEIGAFLYEKRMVNRRENGKPLFSIHHFYIHRGILKGLCPLSGG
jgi:hypothetical protein